MNNHSIFLLFFLFQYISPLLLLLKSDQEKCLIDEFLGKKYFVVKHKIFTEDKRDLKIFLPNLHFVIRDAETNRPIYNRYFTEVKGKITHKVEKTGLYKVCIYLNKIYNKEMLNTKIYANLKITSDNMEKNDLSNAIKNDDVFRMGKKADTIIEIVNHVSELQDEQIKYENENSLETLSNAKMYKYLNLGQVVITAIIGLIQLNNFRRFLKSKNIV